MSIRISKPRTLVALSGVPGSGKSTVVKQIMREHPRQKIVVVNPDSIRKEVTGDAADQSKDSEVWKIAYQRVRDAVDQGRPVVFDATLANPRTRKQIAALVPEDYEKLLVRVSPPLQTSLNRNLLRQQQGDRFVPEHVIRRMWNGLKDNPPSLSEGWTKIIRIS